MNQRDWLAQRAQEQAPEVEPEVEPTQHLAGPAPAPTQREWIERRATGPKEEPIGTARLQAAAVLWADKSEDEMIQGYKDALTFGHGDTPLPEALANREMIAQTIAIQKADGTQGVLREYLSNPELQPILQERIDEMNAFERLLASTAQRNTEGKAQRAQASLGWQALMSTLGVPGFSMSEEDVANLAAANETMGKGKLDFGRNWFIDAPGGIASEFHTTGPSYVAGGLTALPAAFTGAKLGAVAGPKGALLGAGTFGSAGFMTGMGVHSGTQHAGRTFDRVRNMQDENGNPIPESTAIGAAFGVGIANGLLETGGAFAMFKFIPGLDKLARLGDPDTLQRVLDTPAGRSKLARLGEWLTRTSVGVGGEYATELAQELIVEELADYIVEAMHGEDPDKPDDVRLADRAGELGYELALSVPLLVGTAQAVNTVRHARGSVQAANRVEVLREALAAAEQSRLREASPELFHNIVEDMTEDGQAPPVVYVDQAPLMELFQQNEYNLEDIAQVSPILAAELEHAAETGAAVAIRTEDYLAFVAVLPGGEALLQDTRMGPNEPTQREAQAELSRATTELRVLLQDEGVAVDSTFTDDIATELEALGMPEQTVGAQAELLSAMVSTMAERQGVTPQELWTDLNIQLERDGVESTLANLEQELAQQGEQDARTERREARLEEWRGRVRGAIQGDTSGLSGAVDESGNIVLTHYSRKAFAKTDPGRWGQTLSVSPSERGEIKGGVSPMRTFFGIEHAEVHPYKKESGLSNVRLEARVPAELIYPLMTEHGKIDPDDLWSDKERSWSQKRIFDAGYAGYMVDHPQLGKVVALFDAWDVTEVPMRELLQEDGKPVPEIRGTSTQEGNKHGLSPIYRAEATPGEAKRDAKFVQSTNAGNVQKQLDALDPMHKAHPRALNSNGSWTKMMADALGSDDVPAPPWAFIKNINGKGSFKLLSTLTPGQIADADHGFANAAEFREMYEAGDMPITATGKLFLWSFLSRGVSPYTQESMFLNAWDGIDKWLDIAASGKMAENLDAYHAWAKEQAPKGKGIPGAGSTHNLNAFGTNFLIKMSEPHTDGSGRSRLQVIHDAMSEPGNTGRDVRRLFSSFGGGMGIDNKVVSFTLLVAGYPDVMVIDRVQVRKLWNDGRYDGVPNIYDGWAKTDRAEGEKAPKIPGTSMAPLFEGVRGLLIYEAIENKLAAKVPALYGDLGREGSIGRYHWETWVASSQQEASHQTLDAILAEAKGERDAIKGVVAKEGEYGAFAYGAQYGIDGDGAGYFNYEVPNVGLYQFTLPKFNEFLAAIKKPGNGVVFSGFKVSEGGKTPQPWYFKPGVKRQRLGEIAGDFGSKVEQVVYTNGIDPYVADRQTAGEPDAAQQYEAGITIQRSGEPSDAEMDKAGARLLQPLRKDPEVTDAKVDTTQGLFMTWPERAFDMRWRGTAKYDPREAIRRVAQVAKAADQDAGIVSRNVGPDEDHPNARPGLDIRFHTPETYEHAKGLIKQLQKEGIDGFTMSVDDFLGEKGGYVGIRTQWVPELALRFDQPKEDGPGTYAEAVSTPVGLAQEKAKVEAQFAKVAKMFAKLEGADVRSTAHDAVVMMRENYGDYTGKTGADDLRSQGRGYVGRTLEQNMAATAESLGIRTELDSGGPKQELEQRGGTVKRGATRVYADRLVVAFTGNANLSTLAHEMGHLYIEMLRRLDEQGSITPENKAQLTALYDVLGATEGQPLTTPQHELFADGFVEYMREGKSPTPELRSLFDTFSAWLLEIYRSVRRLVDDPVISTELKPIFDRMLATEDAIRENAPDGPVDLGGIVDAETATALDEAYAKVVDAAHREGRKRALSDVWRSASKQYRSRKKALTAEAKAELDKVKAYKVRAYILKGTVPDGVPPEYAKQKLDRATVKAILGVTALPGSMANLTVTEGGMQPSVIANAFGYVTGAEMLAEFSTLQSYTAAVKAKVEPQLEAEFGDLDIGDTDQLANMARDAWAVRERADYYMQAVKALNKKLGDGGPSGPTIRRAMKVLAEEHVRGTAVRDLAPGRYAQNERKLQVTLAEAAADGDQAQVRQVLMQLLFQQYLHNAAKQARIDVEKARDYLKKSQDRKARGRMGKQVINGQRPYRDAIDDLVSTLDLRKISYREIDRSMRNPLADGFYGGVVANIEMILADNPTAAIHIPDSIAERRTVLNYRESNVGDLLDLADTVKSIRHAGNMQNTIRVMGLKVNSDEHAANMAEALREHAPKRRPPVASITGKKTGRQKRQAAIDEIRSYVIKPEAVILEMDGGERGIMWNTLFHWAVEAQNERNRLSEEYAARWTELHKELLAGRKHNELVKFNGEDLTLGQVFGVALNMGSASNRMKLLEGYGWDYDTTLTELSKHLEDRDWRVIQKVWKMIGDLGPAAFDVYENETGVRPQKVDASDIVLDNGTVIQGGYYPVFYNYDLRGQNAQLNRVAELQAEGGALTANNLGRKNVDGGAMESRTSMTAPLDLTLSVIPKHLRKQIMYISHWPGISDTYRILNHPVAREAIFETYGEGQHTSLMAWLENIALDGAPIPSTRLPLPLEAALRHGRVLSTVGFFGLKAGTMVETVFGIGSTMHVAGSANTVRGLSDAITGGTTFALENSKELRDSKTTWNRELRELQTQSTDPNVTAVQKLRTQVSQFLMMPMGYAQQLQNYIAWYAGYNQAQRRGMTDAEAAVHADITLRRAQGLNSPKDAAGSQRGGELHRTLMVAASWSVTFAGLMYQLNRTMTGPGSGKKKTAAMLSFLIGVLYGPRLLMDYWRQRLPDEEEDESWALYLLASTYGDLVQGVPLLRETGGIVSGFAPGGPLALSILDKDVQGGMLLGQLLTGEKDVDDLTEAQLKAVLTLMSTVSYAMGVPLPIAQLAESSNLILTDTDVENFRDVIFGSPN